MAYNIQNLRNCTPQLGRTYLFDANVWRFVVLAPPTVSFYHQNYINFFQRVYELATDETCDNKPKIFVNPILLSEIFHACMNIHLGTFNENEPVPIKIKAYRETNHHRVRKAALLSDFEIYKDGLVTTSENVADCIDTLLGVPDFCDYADQFYINTAQANNMIVVTMDSDFKFEDIEIVTADRTLLQFIQGQVRGRN